MNAEFECAAIIEDCIGEFCKCALCSEDLPSEVKYSILDAPLLDSASSYEVFCGIPLPNGRVELYFQVVRWDKEEVSAEFTEVEISCFRATRFTCDSGGGIIKKYEWDEDSMRWIAR